MKGRGKKWMKRKKEKGETNMEVEIEEEARVNRLC